VGPPIGRLRFVKDMKASFAEENRYKQDEIALRQLHALSQHQGPREKKLPAFRREGDVSAVEGLNRPYLFSMTRAIVASATWRHSE
jgi:hypothetical protein